MILLQDALARRVEEITRDLTMPTASGVKALNVVSGFLPPPREGDQDDEFAVAVRLFEGDDDMDQMADAAKATAKVAIKVVTKTKDVQLGQRMTLMIMERIRKNLHEYPFLEQRYRAILPLKWQAPNGETWPLWEGYMLTTWVVPMPQENWNEGD